MTILSVAQAAAPYIGVDVPDSFISNTDREFVELREFAAEIVAEILDAHDWELLTTLKTEAGDDSTEAFDLASDYDRLPRQQQVWTTRLQYPLRQVMSSDGWMEIDIRDYDYVSGVWIKLGGQIQIKPAPVTGETIKYYYQSNKAVVEDDGVTKKATFTDDTDRFRLSERTLKLGMIYKFRASKGLPYSEEMADYENALSGDILNDSGRTVVHVGRKGSMRGVRRAYPEALT